MRFKFGEEQRQARSRFLNEVDPGVVRTEAGATISQKKDDSTSANGDYQVDYDWKTPVKSKKPSNQSSSYTYEYDDDPFHPGVKVLHSTFGEGKILQRNGSGKDTRIVVFFKNRGQKTLMLRAAKLKPIH